MPVNWCVDCWTHDNRQVPAIGVFDETPLCKPCASLLEIEDGGAEPVPKEPPTPVEVKQPEPEKPKEPRWTETLKKCAALKVNESLELSPDGLPAANYSAQLRSMLAQSNLTTPAKWSVKVLNSRCVEVTRKRDWATEEAEAVSRNEAARDKRGNKAGTVFKQQEHSEAKTLLKSGASVRTTAKEAGLSKRTVDRIRKTIKVELPINCGCGQPLGHKGFCAVRAAKGRDVRKQRDAMAEQKTTRDVAPASGLHDGIQYLTVFLESSGFVQLRLSASLFSLSEQDQDFILSLARRMMRYSKRAEPTAGPRSSRGEKLYPIYVEESYIEEMEGAMDMKDRAQLLGAWLRNDPALKPPAEPIKEKGK